MKQLKLKPLFIALAVLLTLFFTLQLCIVDYLKEGFAPTQKLAHLQSASRYGMEKLTGEREFVVGNGEDLFCYMTYGERFYSSDGPSYFAHYFTFVEKTGPLRWISSIESVSSDFLENPYRSHNSLLPTDSQNQILYRFHDSLLYGVIGDPHIASITFDYVAVPYNELSTTALKTLPAIYFEMHAVSETIVPEKNNQFAVFLPIPEDSQIILFSLKGLAADGSVLYSEYCTEPGNYEESLGDASKYGIPEYL